MMLLLLSLFACSSGNDPHAWFAEGTLLSVSAPSTGTSELSLRPTTVNRNGATKPDAEWQALLGEQYRERTLTLKLTGPKPPASPVGSLVRVEWGRDIPHPVVTWHGPSAASAKRSDTLPPTIDHPDWRCDAARQLNGGSVLPSSIEIPTDASGMSWRCVHTRTVATIELVSMFGSSRSTVSRAWTGQLGGSGPVHLANGSQAQESSEPLHNKPSTRLSARVEAWGTEAELWGLVVDAGDTIILTGALVAADPTPEMKKELETLVERSLGG